MKARTLSERNAQLCDQLPHPSVGKKLSFVVKPKLTRANLNRLFGELQEQKHTADLHFRMYTGAQRERNELLDRSVGLGRELDDMAKTAAELEERTLQAEKRARKAEVTLDAFIKLVGKIA